MKMNGKSMVSGKKNQDSGSNANKKLVMTHGRKHNPGMEPVQSKRVSPSVSKSNP